MTGGTLIVTKKISRHKDFLEEFSALGFPNVSVTSSDKDALYFLIDELKPDLILIDAMFYAAGTPYMIKALLGHKQFKSFRNLNIAVFAVDEYPADLGMMFIANGVKSYIDINDGKKQYNEGLISVCKGEIFISVSAQKRIDLRDEIPAPVKILTEKQKTILLLKCSGFKVSDIADCLCISESTVNNHKEEIYKRLGCDNPFELIIIADKIGLFTLEDLLFFSRKFEVKPKVNRGEKLKKNKREKAA